MTILETKAEINELRTKEKWKNILQTYKAN